MKLSFNNIGKTISTILFGLFLVSGQSQVLMAKEQTPKQTVAKLSTVNLNSANAKEIASVLKGVGLKKAAAIIAYRNTHGDFKAIEEIASVKGIGVATIAKNHNRIKL